MNNIFIGMADRVYIQQIRHQNINNYMNWVKM